MKTGKRVLCGTLVALMAFTQVLAQQTAPSADPAALKKQRDDLEKETRAKLQMQLREIKDKLTKDADLADLQKAAADARKAYENKQATDAKILEAQKVVDQTGKALAGVIDAELAASPEGSAADTEIESSQQALEEQEFQSRLAGFMLGEVKTKLQKDAELRKLSGAALKAENDARDARRIEPATAAAGKALDDARKAYEEKLKALPEKQALDNAQKAYDELVKNSAKVAESRKAAEEARKVYDDKLKEKLAAHAEGGAQTKKQDAAVQAAKDAQAKIKAAQQKLVDARAKLEKDNAKVTEAKAAKTKAAEALRQVITAECAADKAAMEKAQTDLTKKIDEKFAADPKAAELRKQLEDVDLKLKTLNDQIRKLEKAEKK